MHLERTFKSFGLAAASAAAATAAVVAVPVGPASATPDYTITTSGSAAGTTAVTATSSNLTFEDTFLGPYGTAGNPRVGGCSFTSSGYANNGGHTFTSSAATVVTDAALVLTPASTSIIGCTHPLVTPVSITPIPTSSSWKLGFKTKTSTGGTGIVSGVKVRLYAAAGGDYCQADLSGYLAATYTNATGSLVLNTSISGLTVSDVLGSLCDTLGIVDGDPATAAGTVRLAPAPQVS